MDECESFESLMALKTFQSTYFQVEIYPREILFRSLVYPEDRLCLAPCEVEDLVGALGSGLVLHKEFWDKIGSERDHV